MTWFLITQFHVRQLVIWQAYSTTRVLYHSPLETSDSLRLRRARCSGGTHTISPIVPGGETLKESSVGWILWRFVRTYQPRNWPRVSNQTRKSSNTFRWCGQGQTPTQGSFPRDS